MDAILKQIAAETEALTKEYAQGVDQINPDLLGSAAERIRRVGDLSLQALGEMQTFVP